MDEKLVQMLKHKAERELVPDDHDYDYDHNRDAFDAGQDEGETCLARRILGDSGIAYEIPK